MDPVERELTSSAGRLEGACITSEDAVHGDVCGFAALDRSVRGLQRSREIEGLDAVGMGRRMSARGARARGGRDEENGPPHELAVG